MRRRRGKNAPRVANEVKNSRFYLLLFFLQWPILLLRAPHLTLSCSASKGEWELQWWTSHVGQKQIYLDILLSKGCAIRSSWSRTWTSPGIQINGQGTRAAIICISCLLTDCISGTVLFILETCCLPFSFFFFFIRLSYSYPNLFKMPSQNAVETLLLSSFWAIVRRRWKIQF